MTNTRINHTGHAHANTTAARTACRKSMAGLFDAIARIDAHADVTTYRPNRSVNAMVINGAHCESCGETSVEYVSNSYSGCCNEIVVTRCDTGCSHA